MKRAVLVLLALAMAGCGLIGFFQERAGCGLKCPKYSSCKVVQSGVFTATYGCVCDYAEWSYPSKGHPCPAPSPSPEAE